MDTRIQARHDLYGLFFGGSPERDFNLVAVDSDAFGAGPPTQHAFLVLSGLLDGKTPASDETFGCEDVLFLWRKGRLDFLVSRDGAARRLADPSATELAANGAHLRVGWTVGVLPSFQGLLAAQLDPREYRLREAQAWRNMPVLCHRISDRVNAFPQLYWTYA